MYRCVVILILLLAASLSGCATLSGGDSPVVRVAGIEPLPSEGLEVRFALKLRVQNPNENVLIYDGLSVNLELDGHGLASGVSNSADEIPRFSEVLLTVPVSISAFSAIRQLLSLAGNSQSTGSMLTQPIAYKLTGKLGAPKGSVGAIRFSDKGELDLFSSETKLQ